MDDVVVFPPGTLVQLGSDSDPIEAVVIAVMVESLAAAVSYRCDWWNGRSRCSEWIPAAQVRSAKKILPKSLVIGFALHLET